MEARKRQLITLAGKIAVFMKPKLQFFWKYAQVELTPPSPTELPQLSRELSQVMKNLSSIHTVTVREAWLNTLVAIEVGCWFWVGECIGKGHIIGYKV